MSDIYPYAEAAWAYRKAGWQGVIPIGRGPARKSPPPDGYTGWAGVDPSGADIQTWLEGREAAYNIGLHMAPGQYVLDVDAHSGKPAEASLAALVEAAGPLPATWTSTARGQGAPSRQHFFRATLPEGRVWVDHPGPLPGLDALHTGHRYAVVWPSVNPDASGATYEWYDPTGELYEGVPWPADLAELPATWIEALSKPGEPMAGAAASDELTLSTIRRFRAGDPCRMVETSLTAEFARIAGATSGGALHDPGKLYPLVAYGFEGHRGVQLALSQHQTAYVEARVRLRDESEGSASADWWRQVRGAVGKKMHADPGAEIPTTCTCDDPFDGIIPDGPLEQSVSQPTDSLESRESDLPAPAESYLDFLRKQLVNTKTLGLQPKAEPLVPGAFYLDKLAWIYGAPKSFKSFLALDLAASVATGRGWQGFPVGKSGPVLYLVAEGKSGIEDRVRAWEDYNETEMAGVEFLPVAVQANSAEQWKAFVALAREIDPVLVVVDTQARVTSGMEENSATEMGEFIRRLDSLRMATGALVLTVHHSGRNGEHLRGSIAIDGAADTVLKIVRTENTCNVQCVYQKDAEEFEPFLTRVENVGESLVVRRDFSPQANTDAALPSWLDEWWKLFGSEWTSISALVRNEVIATEKRFRDHRERLLTSGVIEAAGEKTLRRYRLGASYRPTVPVRHGTVATVAEALPSTVADGSSTVATVETCRTCGEPIDKFLWNQGFQTHPTC